MENEMKKLFILSIMLLIINNTLYAAQCCAHLTDGTHKQPFIPINNENDCKIWASHLSNFQSYSYSDRGGIACGGHGVYFKDTKN